VVQVGTRDAIATWLLPRSTDTKSLADLDFFYRSSSSRAGNKRYDFEAQSVAEAAEIVDEIKRGMEPFRTCCLEWEPRLTHIRWAFMLRQGRKYGLTANLVSWGVSLSMHICFGINT
jgi:hypothetical protein